MTSAPPPAPRERDRQTAERALETLRARLDEHFRLAVLRDGTQIACGSGCDSCCHRRFGVFALEADRIRAALSRLPAKVRARVRAQATDPAHQGHCALLLDGRCAVYEQRPLICRAHGLPLAVAASPGAAPEGPAASAPSPSSPSALSVSWCPHNFRSAPPAPATVLRVEAVDAPLAVAATLWDGEGRRVPLATLAAAPDP